MQAAGAAAEPNLAITSLGLSAALASKYATGVAGHPINHLFKWQSEALRLPGVLEGQCSLVYSASTSAGKTLVAELLMIRRLEEAGKQAKALFVLPLRALVSQKVAYFAKLIDGTGLTCAAYQNGQGELPMPPKLNVAVCTIEKACMVVQSMAASNRLGEIVAVVFDEFHVLGDCGRGATIERTIAQLLLHSRQHQQQMIEAAAAERVAAAASAAAGAAGRAVNGAESAAADANAGQQSALTASSAGAAAAAIAPGASSRRGFIQIVAMSATLPNTSDLVSWLRPCELYQGGGKREVPLHEYIVTLSDGGHILTTRGEATTLPPLRAPLTPAEAGKAAAEAAGAAAANGGSRSVKPSAPTKPGTARGDSSSSRGCSLEIISAAVDLARETCAQERGVLCFCASKACCVSYAKSLASAGVVPAKAEAVSTLLDELDHMCPDGTTDGLVEAVNGRVGFYHAGMHEAEQKLIERAFNEGTLRLLTATSALGEGVNLPVRRVIFTSLNMGISPLPPLKYQQMRGRAGRAGLETFGESFILIRASASDLSAKRPDGELHRAIALATGPMPDVASKLMPRLDAQQTKSPPVAESLPQQAQPVLQPAMPQPVLPPPAQPGAQPQPAVGGGELSAAPQAAAGPALAPPAVAAAQPVIAAPFAALPAGDGIGMLLLDAVVSGQVRNGNDISRLLGCTLWGSIATTSTAVSGGDAEGDGDGGRGGGGAGGADGGAGDVMVSGGKAAAEEMKASIRRLQRLDILAVIQPPSAPAPAAAATSTAIITSAAATAELLPPSVGDKAVSLVAREGTSEAARPAESARPAEATFSATPFGHAVAAASSMLSRFSDKKTGELTELLRLRDELRCVRSHGLRLSDDLHILFLCVAPEDAEEMVSKEVARKGGSSQQVLWVNYKAFYHHAWSAEERGGRQSALSELMDLLGECGMVGGAAGGGAMGGGTTWLPARTSGSQALLRAVERVRAQPDALKRYKPEMAIVVRLWLASLLSATLQGHEPVDIAHMYGLSAADVTENVANTRQYAATRATAMYRFAAEHQRAWERRNVESASGGGEGGGGAGGGGGMLGWADGEGSWWMLESLLCRIKERLWWGERRWDDSNAPACCT